MMPVPAISAVNVKSTGKCNDVAFSIANIFQLKTRKPSYIIYIYIYIYICITYIDVDMHTDRLISIYIFIYIYIYIYIYVLDRAHEMARPICF